MRSALYGVTALASLLAAARLFQAGGGGKAALSGAILLLVAALGAGAVALGAGDWGPDAETAPDLSARLGTGALAGVLAGLFHALLTVVAGALGLFALLGVTLDAGLAGADWTARAVQGLFWGLAFGAFYRALPGSSAVGRALWFSLAPSLWLLFWIYPVIEGLGWLGTGAGTLTFVFVLLGNAIAAIPVGWAIAWAGRTTFAPLDEPLVP